MADRSFGSDTLSGGHLSQQILAQLARLRAMGSASLAGPVTIADLSWGQSQGFAIRRDPTRQIWHSGHVEAVLTIGDAAVVGSQTGGVWLVDPARRLAPPDQSHPAFSISNDWTNTDVRCMKYGPDGELTCFVGCGGSGALVFVEFAIVLGLLEFRKATAIPVPSAGSVNAIAVLPVPRRIVLGTDKGAWWSVIPASPHLAGAYSWNPAQGLPYDAPASGLAVGPNDRVVAAVRGSSDASAGIGLYRGTWQAGRLPGLNFTAATIAGADAATLRRTSIDSCDADRRVIYAVAADADGMIGAVLRSSDGGTTWSAVATPDKDVAGGQGSYNNCLAVSPFNSSVVAIGWQLGGPFVSEDGGQTWRQPQVDGADPNLHRDWHALFFPRHPDGNDQVLFAGSDGGLAVTHDLLQTSSSEYNKHLATIQFYREPYGRFGASSRFPGLVAGGTQDNGNQYCELLREPAVWHWLDGGDGGTNRFVDTLGALLHTSLLGPIRLSFWDPSARAFHPGFDATGQTGVLVPVDGNTDGLKTRIVDAVAVPTAKRGDDLMYACAGKDKRVYGLFAKSDGSDAYLTRVATLASDVVSVASYDGNSILVGTVDGTIVRVDPVTGQGASQPFAASAVGYGKIARIQVTVDRAYALGDGYTLLRWTGSEWRDVAYGMITFAVHPAAGSKRVFAAWDDRVWASDDDGDTWQTAVAGLPAAPHCSCLEIAEDGRGGHVLYLATYGRNVWQAQLDYVRRFEPPRLPQQVANILVGVIDDGGGLIRVGNRIIRVPPRPPADRMVDGIARYAEAATLPTKQQRLARLAALRDVEKAVAKEIKRLGGGRG